MQRVRDIPAMGHATVARNYRRRAWLLGGAACDAADSRSLVVLGGNRNWHNVTSESSRSGRRFEACPTRRCSRRANSGARLSLAFCLQIKVEIDGWPSRKAQGEPICYAGRLNRLQRIERDTPTRNASGVHESAIGTYAPEVVASMRQRSEAPDAGCGFDSAVGMRRCKLRLSRKMLHQRYSVEQGHTRTPLEELTYLVIVVAGGLRYVNCMPLKSLRRSHCSPACHYGREAS